MDHDNEYTITEFQWKGFDSKSQIYLYIERDRRGYFQKDLDQNRSIQNKS